MAIAGKPGGSAPDAMMCSARMRLRQRPCWLSNGSKLPVSTSTAETVNRVTPALMRSKSTSRSRVAFSGAVS
jgi:hypothetical protein